MTDGITVRVAVNFLPEQSQPDAGKWFWVYHIRIENGSHEQVQLILDTYGEEGQEIIDDAHAIVSSSSGPEHYVSIMSFVDKDKLEPGSTILTNHKSMAVVGILDDDADPMVNVMKVTVSRVLPQMQLSCPSPLMPEAL